MNFREFIKILKVSVSNAFKQIKNDKDFYMVLGITYSLEKMIKKSKKN